MSNANNFLQNMGMQMPMFAAANQQTGANEDVDLHDIFADYFNEDSNANEQLQLNSALAAQQQTQQQQQVSLPTGQGIKTAWHSGSLPAMQQGCVSSSGILSGGEEPSAKKSRGEELYLPTGGQQQPQMTGMVNEPSMGGIGGNNGITQQQLALAQAASGVGALSGRLGFTLPNNVNTGMAGAMNSGMIGQQNHQPQQQREQQQQVNFQTQMATQQQSRSGGINLPIGMGMKFGAGGSIMSQAGMQTGGMQAGGGFTNNGNINSSEGMNNGGIMANNFVDRGRVEDQMAAERRLRNREHAKRSRVRKKFMLESLQQQVRGLQDENSTLRMLVQKHIPKHALKIIDECCSKSVLFSAGDTCSKGDGGGDGTQDEKLKETPLLRSDFSLIESLTSGQQNFVLSDPRLPDNPIVFASPGFYELTGYTREQVLGRNCRFLQGAGTDRKAVDVIRTAIANGTDATVCLLNYKADGTPFWNQLFVAALRDGDNCIVNYVGVQTMIEPNAGASALEDRVNAAHPMTVGVDDDHDKDANE